MKKIIYCFCLLGSLFTVQAGNSPYDAARHGDLDALRQYRFEGIDLFVPDERGFTPYELAALYADHDKPDSVRRHVETMLWLKEYHPEKHHYGKASISLVQAGLNALGYPVGRPDGLIGKKTTDTIKEFQKDNDLAQTGRLGPQWLGVFYQDILKDLQFKLTKLGYNTKGTDGMMGRNTRKAMLKYRQENHLSNPDYPYLDALLLTSVDGAYRSNEKKKKQAIAKQKQQAKENQMRFVQAGLRTLGHRIGKIDGMYGSKTSNAIKKFQKRYKLSVTGDIDDKTLAKMRVIFLKETQRKMKYLGYSKIGKPDGKNGKQTSKALAHFHKNYNVSGHGLTAGLIAAVDDEFDSRMDREASKTAKRKQKKSSHKKSKSKRSGSKATVNAKIRKSSKSSSRKSSNRRINTVATTSRRTTSVHGNRARGRMSFNRKSGRVVGCSISGRRIPIEWCEPFYPLPRNNHCEATFKPSSGAVINLWCK
ncbi:MAG: peptidoglycan-binding protein [Gammaproteobacteria bacterium]|nr:peptidoglycan-binding protein [Gammaproteobacteria bacterium]